MFSLCGGTKKPEGLLLVMPLPRSTLMVNRVTLTIMWTPEFMYDNVGMSV